MKIRPPRCEKCNITKDLYTKPMKYGPPMILCGYCKKQLQSTGMTKLDEEVRMSKQHSNATSMEVKYCVFNDTMTVVEVKTGKVLKTIKNPASLGCPLLDREKAMMWAILTYKEDIEKVLGYTNTNLLMVKE